MLYVSSDQAFRAPTQQATLCTAAKAELKVTWIPASCCCQVLHFKASALRQWTPNIKKKQVFHSYKTEKKSRPVTHFLNAFVIKLLENNSSNLEFAT